MFERRTFPQLGVDRSVYPFVDARHRDQQGRAYGQHILRQQRNGTRIGNSGSRHHLHVIAAGTLESV